MSLAYDQFSLSKLDPSLILQESVNHGGVLFKVYIIGEAIKVVHRFSLPDVNELELLNNHGVLRLPRVSCESTFAADADSDTSSVLVGNNSSIEPHNKVVLTSGRAWVISLTLTSTLTKETLRACVPIDGNGDFQNLLYRSLQVICSWEGHEQTLVKC